MLVGSFVAGVGQEQDKSSKASAVRRGTRARSGQRKRRKKITCTGILSRDPLVIVMEGVCPLEIYVLVAFLFVCEDTFHCHTAAECPLHLLSNPTRCLKTINDTEGTVHITTDPTKAVDVRRVCLWNGMCTHHPHRLAAVSRRVF